MRTIMDLCTKWAFSKEATGMPETMPTNWVWVNLPHSWNDIDGQDGDNDFYRGTCWYAKTVEKGDLPTADRYYLEIQGANSSADVYVNGKHLAHHDGGYSTWRVDMTDHMEYNNLITIAVDNAPNKTVYPQTADFTFYGGLYRKVSIIAVSDSHFDLDYFGGPGIKVTPIVEGKDAKVEVEVYLTNAKSGQQLVYTLKDQEGNVVATKTGCACCETKAEFVIENAHLWHGMKDPYLYKAEVALVQDEEILDDVETRFGCRYFEIDPERGFILNGEEYPLRGVSRHQDRWGYGNALLPEHHEEDIQLICEMGATTIRLAHYQHDQYFYDLCDEYGQVIWAEIPYISQHMPTGRENTISQMRELVVQNYNHPSIVVWGLSNEISIGGADADLEENHKILNDMVHEMDKTRLTTIACVSMCSMDEPYIQIPDVVSYNHYFGWYGGDTSMNGPWFDKFHEKHPNIPIGCSEYGCEALNWHNSDPKQGDYSEEYQAFYHEELIKQLYSRKYMWATHVWNMFDFGADARNEGGENGQNHKGLVTFDRKYKKDSFYAYKAWLSQDPFVHICGKRYVDRVEDVTKVTVYSNQPVVELFVNGESLGKQESPEHFFYFQVPNVGTSKLVAVAGECTDESTINKVEEFNAAYRMQEKGAILNWFDIEEPAGFYSLNDKISDILKSEGGRALFAQLMGGMVAGEGGNNPAAAAMNNPEMFQMMGGFTLLRMVSLAGGMMGLDVTKEMLLGLNAQLNQIPRV